MSFKINPFLLKIMRVLFSVFQNNKNADQNIAVAKDSESFDDVGFAQDRITSISEQGIQLICGFEGLYLSAYDDGFGLWTIGYGTTQYPNKQPVKQGDRCTLEQAKSYRQDDLEKFEKAVQQVVKVFLNQRQFDALVSLTYNIGIGAFQKSTLLKYLNAGEYQAASHQFDVWIKAGGQTVQGLVNRRAAEKALFLS